MILPTFQGIKNYFFDSKRRFVVPILPLLLFFAFFTIFSPSSSHAEETTTGLLRAFHQIKNLVIGDTVFAEETGQLKPETVIGKEWVGEAVDVYNLSVDNSQTYFANDIAVHNKGWAAKAYFYWDEDRDGCHDHPNGTQPCETDGLIDGKAEPIVTSQPMANWSDNQNRDNPNWSAAQVGEAYFHYTASWKDDFTEEDKNFARLFLLNNENCVNSGGIRTKYDEPTAGACMDRWLTDGSSAVFPFAQTNRDTGFRIGGIHFKDYDTGANRQVYRYQTYCAECSDPWCPYCHGWGPPWMPGYPPSVYFSDIKPEKDFRDANNDGVADDESFGSWPNRMLITQAAEFTADYTGWYFFGKFQSRGGDGPARIYEISTRPSGGVSLSNLPPRLCGRGGLPYKINECEESPPRWPDYYKPEAFGYTGNFVCEAAHYKVLHKGGGQCRLDKTKEYLMITAANGGDTEVFEGRYWSWPFLMWANARLAGVVPDDPSSEPVAAIPLVEAPPPGGTIEGRVWNDTRNTDCNRQGIEPGVAQTVTANPGGYPVTPDAGNGLYEIQVPPGNYTVSIMIPTGYTTPACSPCPSAAPGSVCEIRDVAVTSGGRTRNINFPLIAVSTISGHVWDDTAIQNCSQGEAEEPDIDLNGAGWNVYATSLTDTYPSTTRGSPNPGDYEITTVPNGDDYRVCVVPSGVSWQLGCTRRDGLDAGVFGFCTDLFDLTNDIVVNFGLIYNTYAWIQTAIGDIAAGTTIQSLIPDPLFVRDYDTYPSDGEPYLSRALNSSPGIVVAQNNGSISIGSGQTNVNDWRVPGLGPGTYTLNTSYLSRYHYAGLEDTLRGRIEEEMNAGSEMVSMRNGGCHRTGRTMQLDHNGVYSIINTSGVTLEGHTQFDGTVDDPKAIVMLIDGDLAINGNFTPDNGFYTFIVNGAITIDPTVTELKGIFLADGTIDTGDTTDQNRGLKTTGMFISWGTPAPAFVFGRDWDDKRRPTEYFVYDPQFLVELQESLGESRVSWREI